MQNTLQQLYGNIDIYLFDQLLKGRFDDCKRILDAGCGGGRNLVYFLQNGYEVFGIDPSRDAVRSVRELAGSFAPSLSSDNFSVATAENLAFPDQDFDLVISSAVLHFAKNQQHFESMLLEMWRVLKAGGYLFARLASDTGIEKLVKPLGDGQYILPDGSTRFLVNEQMLLDYTRQLGAVLFEPIKTTNVQNLRCMTTWCLMKQQ